MKIGLDNADNNSIMVVLAVSNLERVNMKNPELCGDCGDELVVIRDEFSDAAICERCECGDEIENDGQPSEYDEWQDFYGGDDWDHGQYDEY